MIVPVILSGGSGSRLWPLSREAYPKQLIRMLSENESMIQQTWLRIEDFPDISPPIVVCNEQHRFTIAEQLLQCGATEKHIILEPCGRNTAPAIAAAALFALSTYKDPTLLVLPADHVIKDKVAFHGCIADAVRFAANGSMVTFGVVADRPETGFGYIKAGKKEGDNGLSLESFTEKPDTKTAQSFIDSGDYYWNSGIFVFKARDFLSELESFAPEVVASVTGAISDASVDLDFIRLGSEAFASSPEVSVDYAVMEHTQKGMVVPADIGWSDVGSWDSFSDLLPHDENGNSSGGETVLLDCENSYVFSDSRLVAAIGLSNVVVIETGDAVLVMDKKSSQKVKDVVNTLKQQGRKEAQHHRTVHRPWGKYEEIDSSTRFQVKHIRVNPGASLSLQKHHHRAEHWVVVSGTAKVTCGERQFLVSENESTYIPLGEKHRLENPGKIPLDLIEVQSGSYLGEDDIVRFDDIYGRTEVGTASTTNIKT